MTPGKRKASASPAKPLPSEVATAVQKLQSHVASLEPPVDGQRKLPRSIINHLATISCMLRRHSLQIRFGPWRSLVLLCRQVVCLFAPPVSLLQVLRGCTPSTQL